MAILRNKATTPPVSSTELVEQVKLGNRRVRHINQVALGFAAAMIIIVLTFLTIFTIVNTHQLRKIIDTNHATNVAQTKREIALINDNAKQTQANRDLLAQQDAYLLCLVSLFTHHTAINESDLARCKPPFVATPTSSNSGSASTSFPKANVQPSPSTPSGTSATPTANTAPTPQPAQPEPASPAVPSSGSIKTPFPPLNSILNILGL